VRQGVSTNLASQLTCLSPRCSRQGVEPRKGVATIGRRGRWHSEGRHQRMLTFKKALSIKRATCLFFTHNLNLFCFIPIFRCFWSLVLAPKEDVGANNRCYCQHLVESRYWSPSAVLASTLVIYHRSIWYQCAWSYKDGDNNINITPQYWHK
jgi:hypothetical protein